MSALGVLRRVRLLVWGLAVLALIAIVAWRAAAWDPTTGADDSSVFDGGPTPQPGLTLYRPSDRVPVPSMQGTTLDGAAFRLSDLLGKIVVINVWGSWCGPCRKETPGLVRLARKDASHGVRFVGIDTRDNTASAKAFVRRYRVPYPSVIDEGGEVLLQFRGILPSAVIPSSVVIDRLGRVAARIIGPVDYQTLKSLLGDELARDRAGAP